MNKKKILHKYPVFSLTKAGKLKQTFETPLTKAGKLKRAFLPAIYLDSSILIEYLRSDGAEVEKKEDLEKIPGSHDTSEQSIYEAFRKAVTPEKRMNKIAEIRRKIILEFDKLKVTPVTSTLAHLELIEWHASYVYNTVAVEEVGTHFIKKKGQKDIGKDIRKILTKYWEYKNKPKKSGPTSGIEHLAREIFLNDSYLECHGLDGIFSVDLVQFDFTLSYAWSSFAVSAALQMGMADILHLAVAKHLGCQYFASLDLDFKRVKEFAEETIGINVLVSPEEILKIL